MALSAPQHIGSKDPFASTYNVYRNKGWNVLPLPEGKKKSPPSKDDDPQGLGFTGRNGRMAEDDDYDAWLADDRWEKGNIAIRVGNTVEYDGKTCEVVGIDVDAYGDKHGTEHLRQLEKRYGPLPNTWTSSARADGVSGIRYYLVPAGYEFMGKPRIVDPADGKTKASDSIEIVQRVHRYGVCFPSYNPDAKSQYWWYSTGQAPDGVHVTYEIPRVEQLAELPERWFKFLTRGGTESEGNVPMDMDSEPSQLRAWARKHFVPGKDMCQMMTKVVTGHVEKIENASDHHDPLVAAHWSLFNMGAEGHTGWASAVGLAEAAWLDRIANDNVRSLAEAKHEVSRSAIGTLRKLKGKWDELQEQKLEWIEKHDPCVRTANTPPPVRKTSTGSKSRTGKNSAGVASTSSTGGSGLIPVIPKPQGRKSSEEFERNEDGNAEHFLSIYGKNLKFVPNHPDGQSNGVWLLFSNQKHRWRTDTKGTEVRHLFRHVKQLQQKDAARVLQNKQNAVIAAGGRAAATPQQNAELAEAKEWVRFALESGNSARVTNSLKQAATFPDMSVLYENLDQDPMLLPVANGVIRFHTKEQRLAGADPFVFVEDPVEVKELLLTQNTNVPYIPFALQENHEDAAVRESYRKFSSYMEVFLKNNMSEEAFHYILRLLGLSILGVNIKKAIFLVGLRDTGKSTFQNMMSSALGELAIWREPAIFEDTPFKSALAEALSRRVCMVGELGEKHMDASLFKRITGGDEVSCQLKNINKPVTLRARCTVISGCNSAPEVPHVDDATKERFVVIPFRHQVSSAEKDPAAQDDLMQACKIPLLALLIESCADGIMLGVNEVPDELQLETREFVSSLNEMSDFIRDCLVIAPESEFLKHARKDLDDPRDPKPKWANDKCLGSTALYKVYKTYARTNNMEVLSSNKFVRRMKDAGLVRDGSKNAEGELRWLGVTLKNSHRVKGGESSKTSGQNDVQF